MNGLIETEIGTIASAWKVAPLEAICEPPQYGYTASAEEQGNVRFLRITDITDSGVNWSTVPFCDCPPDLLAKYRLACGDIVFARIGATTGKSYLIRNPPLSVFASYLIRVRAKPEIDPGFLSHFFRSNAYWRQVNAQKNANLKKGVSGSLLKTLVVPIPPLPEQRKIAAVLGLVQRAIAQQVRLIALTTELKKALLHRLFTEGLRGEPQKQTEIGPVPENWEIVKLARLFEIKHGYAFEGEFFAAQGRYVLLTPGHFFEEGGFRDQKEKTKYYVGEIPRGYLLAKGDLLVAMTEQKAGLLGSTIIIPESERFLHNQRLGLIGNLDEQRLNKLFLYYFFNTATVRKQIFLTSSGSKVRHTSPSKIRELSIALPNLDEQQAIVQLLKAVDARLEIAERKQQSITDLFLTLLHQLMTAEIRVNRLELSGIEMSL